MNTDEKTMIVTNKGRRTWPVKNAAGDTVRLEPMESVEMREIDALRLINGYPLDISPAGPATMSSANLERAEQSLRDRIANVERREKACEEREKALKVTESDKEAEAPAKKAGRPPKSDKAE